VNGCPVYIPEFLSVLTAALQGIPYAVPDYAVCIECRMNENECLYDRGITCLGPVTRAGCNSWCVNNGNLCYGCRGMVSSPYVKGMKQVLEKHHVPIDFVVNKMDMYNKCRELDRNGR
jgi:sulfhydrogenase subunit delta